jgi:predicted phosphodiesterase
MIIALLADIHANREALSACLAHAQRAGAGQYVFLGDFVGYGADPAWVIDTISAHVEDGAAAVRGNHDEAVTLGPRATMNEDAQKVIAWTRTQLNDLQLDFLARLPLQRESGEHLYVHANAWAPERWEYIAGPFEARSSMMATPRRYTFCGHVHDPSLYHMGTDMRASAFTPIAGVPIPLGNQRRWLVIPGSVGQPRDGIRAACYALLDSATQKLTFCRIPYDFETAAAKIRHAGLPERFVVLLEQGR